VLSRNEASCVRSDRKQSTADWVGIRAPSSRGDDHAERPSVLKRKTSIRRALGRLSHRNRNQSRGLVIDRQESMRSETVGDVGGGISSRLQYLQICPSHCPDFQPIFIMGRCSSRPLHLVSESLRWSLGRSDSRVATVVVIVLSTSLLQRHTKNRLHL
jgi:hypothetical protein